MPWDSRYHDIEPRTQPIQSAPVINDLRSHFDIPIHLGGYQRESSIFKEAKAAFSSKTMTICQTDKATEALGRQYEDLTLGSGGAGNGRGALIILLNRGDISSSSLRGSRRGAHLILQLPKDIQIKTKETTAKITSLYYRLYLWESNPSSVGATNRAPLIPFLVILKMISNSNSS